MSEMKIIITVTERSFGEKFVAFLRSLGSPVVLSVPARGTACDETLDYLGIEATEKTLLFSFAYGNACDRTMRELDAIFSSDLPGSGIAVSIPVESVGGASALQYIKSVDEADNANEEGEKRSMSKTGFQLIIAITNQGYTDLVMGAARGAKASGGTVIHAKGTCNAVAEKFCKLSIVDEKEMVFIVTPEESKADIMKAIMQKAGKDTPAHTVVFTLPVSDVSGIG